IPAAYGLEALPTTFIVDRLGRIVLRRRGAANWDTTPVRDFLRWLAARPAPQASAGPVQAAVHLVPRRLRSAPGGAARFALRIEPAPGWHVYAPDPGDVGLPLRVEWEAPEGVQISPLAWPPATPLVVNGERASLVYTEAVEAEGEIRVAADAEPGTSLRVAATVSWGACREVCVPQSARVVLEVDVVPLATRRRADPAAATHWAGRSGEAAAPGPHGAHAPSAASSPSGSMWSRLASSTPSISTASPMRTRSGPPNGARSSSSIVTPGRRFSSARYRRRAGSSSLTRRSTARRPTSRSASVGSGSSRNTRPRSGIGCPCGSSRGSPRSRAIRSISSSDAACSSRSASSCTWSQV